MVICFVGLVSEFSQALSTIALSFNQKNLIQLKQQWWGNADATACILVIKHPSPHLFYLGELIAIVTFSKYSVVCFSVKLHGMLIDF